MAAKNEPAILFYKIMTDNPELSEWFTRMSTSIQKVAMEAFLLGYTAAKNPNADFRVNK